MGSMKRIDMSYNPYRLSTEIAIEGSAPSEDSILQTYLKNERRLQEWIADFPQALVDELNWDAFEIHFKGSVLDWEDVDEVFSQAKANGILSAYEPHFHECITDNDVKEKVVSIFKKLTDADLPEFQEPELHKAFENVRKAVFPINVVATMSSGKSTLINALLRQRLMPAKNEACTATVTHILDNDKETFNALAYNMSGEIVREFKHLTLKAMEELNTNPEVIRINAEGDIPFLDAKGTALELIDTPGPNNSRDHEHQKKTYDSLNNSANNLVLYVLNATQLETNDDARFLEYVAGQIKKGGRQAHDRFLFVVNKMDNFRPEDESVEDAVESVREYLGSFGIADPQIFPCSALSALDIRTVLQEYSSQALSQMSTDDLDEKNLLNTFTLCKKLNKHPALHLERYSTMTPSVRRELEARTKQAEQNGDFKTLALIHSGILSVEAAIKTYVKKYALTKTVKDLVETFESIIESSEALSSISDRISSDETMARTYADRAREFENRLKNGSFVRDYRERIESIVSVDRYKEFIDTKRNAMITEASQIFDVIDGDYIFTNKSDANEWFKQYLDAVNELLPAFQTDISVMLDEAGKNACEQMIKMYKESLDAIDKTAIVENSDGEELDYSTFDLIKSELSSLESSIQSEFDETHISGMLDSMGDVRIVIKQEQVKTGEKTIQEKVGVHEVVVGYKDVAVGTRKIRNPERHGIGVLAVWKPWKIEETVYERRPITEMQPIYRTKIVPEFTMIEKRLEEYSLSKDAFMIEVSNAVRQSLDVQIQKIIHIAESGLDGIKKQLLDRFDSLNTRIVDIQKKMLEFQSMNAEMQKIIASNKELLAWLNGIRKEINDTLSLKENTL